MGVKANALETKKLSLRIVGLMPEYSAKRALKVFVRRKEGAFTMPLRPELRLRLVNVGAVSQKGFVVVGGMNAQRALFIGREVLPIALFEYQLGKGFSCLANIESLPTPAGCKQADTLQMGTCVDTNILGLKLPFIAFVGRHNPIRVQAHQLLAQSSVTTWSILIFARLHLRR